MSTSTALITAAAELQPNPPAYGRLLLRAGAWDQLQARKAYGEIDEPPPRLPAVDKRI
jgi:hypothetical protein